MADNLLRVIPVLRISEFAAARAYYCDQLGFNLDWSYEPGGDSNPTYAGISREGAELHLSSFSGDSVFGAVANFLVVDVDALYEEFSVKGVNVDLAPYDQTWGAREMYLRDPDGNSLRFQQVPSESSNA